MENTEYKNSEIQERYLKNLVKIQIGYQTRTRIFENPKGEFSLIRAQDFDEYGCLKSNKLIRFIPERNPDPYIVKQGDILFLSRGSENIAYYLDDYVDKSIASNTFYILRVTSNFILPQFLAWWLNHTITQLFFKSQASRANISFVSKSVLEKVNIIVPPTSIQEKIITLNRLWFKEKQLYSNLINKKSHFIEAICLAAIKNKERVDE